MAYLVSPKEDVASVQVLAVQEAQTKIKEAIVDSYKNNTSKADLTLKLNSIIAEASSVFSDFSEKARIKRALAQNAVKWEYYYRQSIQVINANTLKYIQRLANRNVTVHQATKSYNVDLNEYIGLHPKQQNQIISQFRGVLTEDKNGLAIVRNYDSIVKKEIRNLASDPANIYRVDKNGKPYKMNLRNHAEMKTRYEANNQELLKLKEAEVDLVWTSSHPDASPRCTPYQGKLYSISGRTGVIDGIKFTPLQDALNGPNSDGNGIINGYNCRHRLIPYTPKSSPPREYDSATIRRENSINNRQRQYERDIRNLKLEEKMQRANGNTDYAKILRRKWQSKTKSYREYSLNNGRAYYDWRTRITTSEVETYEPNERFSYDSYSVKDPKTGQVISSRVLIDDDELKSNVYSKYNLAKKAEPGITNDIKKAAEDTGAKPIGLAFRLKSKTSLERKIKSDYVTSKILYPDKNETISEIAHKKTADVNRYTYELPVDDFVEVYKKLQANLTSEGNQTINVKNTFKLKRTAYRGINTKVKTLDGTIFEVQYHTKESFELKDKVNHELYEKARELSTSPEEYKKLMNEMINNSSRLTIPPGIDKI